MEFIDCNVQSDKDDGNDEKTDYTSDSDYELPSKKSKNKSKKSNQNKNRSLNEDNGITDKKAKTKISEYMCEICGNKYKKKVLLASHMLWHTDKKPYKCE